MFGFINLNKPAGFTSHDCIAKLRKILNTRKIGHGGTLDPAATGVLPVAVGKATRLLQFLPETKAYQARIRLGIATTTDDLEGEISKKVEQINLTSTQIIESLNTFVGTTKQIPPIYSAIKKDGKKLYELARKGEQIVVEPRNITIYSLKLIEITQSPVWELTVDIKCSPGTYIRAIARDLGEILGVGGTLAHLIRTESCGMHLENSMTFEEIENQMEQQNFSLIEPALILQNLPKVTLNQDCTQRWCYGQLIDLTEATSQNLISTSSEGDYMITTREDGTFLGISILFQREEIMKIKPKIVCVG